MQTSSGVLKVLLLVLAAAPSVAEAQRGEQKFAAAVHVAVADGSQFEGTDLGIGGRFGWSPLPMLGIEAEFTHYPGDYPDGRAAFSSGRWEGFFGGTVGPRFGRVRPFARIRPGLLSYREASEPFACIAIFPPPLACTLSGASVFAFDLGGGVEVGLGERTFVRVDAGDRMLRYEGPVFDAERRVRDDSFWSHGFRLAVGAGWGW